LAVIGSIDAALRTVPRKALASQLKSAADAGAAVAVAAIVSAAAASSPQVALRVRARLRSGMVMLRSMKAPPKRRGTAAAVKPCDAFGTPRERGDGAVKCPGTPARRRRRRRRGHPLGRVARGGAEVSMISIGRAPARLERLAGTTPGPGVVGTPS
jgi:hypothetical protein